MNIEKYKKYVNEMCNNVKNKLGKESEEFDFFITLADTFNEVCNRNRKLENTLDEIEKILNKPQFEYDNIPTNFEDEILKIKEIIKKAKGE